MRETSHDLVVLNSKNNLLALLKFLWFKGKIATSFSFFKLVDQRDIVIVDIWLHAI